MADDSTREVMDGYLDALRGGGDFGRFYAPSVVWTFMESGEQVHGREAVRALVVDLHNRAFAAHPEVRSMVVGDGVAMLEADFVGTHIGEFEGLPATGAAVRLPYCVAYDVAGGAITALRAYFPTRKLHALLADAVRSAAPAHV